LSNEAPAFTDRKDYWNEYYAKSGSKGSNPSQFAVFVHGELEGPSHVIDIGCGSGRDSFFFAANGHDVLGIDGSASAIEHCRSQSEHNAGSAKFECVLVDDPVLVDTAAAASAAGAERVVVYARFFVHAITDAEEGALIAAAAKLCKGGGLFAVEFRTRRDAAQSKVTGAHYRRFVDPLKFMVAAEKAGFEAQYFVEGYGFAKYKNDDAHVARILLTLKSAS
jgi:SAM-dependent methyltransferase